MDAFGDISVVLQPESAVGGEGKGVILQSNSKVFRYSSGAVQSFDSTDQDPFGVVFFACDDIEQAMYTVAEVDVADPTLLIKSILQLKILPS